jgi:hypothetical protein
VVRSPPFESWRRSRRSSPESTATRIASATELLLRPDGWLFPAETKSGHIEASSLRKQHAKVSKASEVAPFELYVFRHTCLTRWSKWMDLFTLHRVAGHADMKTTMRYVHPSNEDMDEAVMKARLAQRGHTSGHTGEMNDSESSGNLSVANEEQRELTGATRRDRTGDLLITNQPLYQLS